VRKQGLDGTRERACGAACAAEVVQPERVGCCGWAGDKGWTVPELNEHALRDLRPVDPRRLHAGLLEQPHLRDRGWRSTRASPTARSCNLVDAAAA